jgi:hypothetical protein
LPFALSSTCQYILTVHYSPKPTRQTSQKRKQYPQLTLREPLKTVILGGTCFAPDGNLSSLSTLLASGILKLSQVVYPM